MGSKLSFTVEVDVSPNVLNVKFIEDGQIVEEMTWEEAISDWTNPEICAEDVIKEYICDSVNSFVWECPNVNNRLNEV